MKRPVLMHRPFCLEEVRWREYRLCGYGKMMRRPARRTAYLGCSLLEKVFQRFALQAVPPDIFLVIFAKSFRREEKNVFRFERWVAFIQ